MSIDRDNPVARRLGRSHPSPSDPQRGPHAEADTSWVCCTGPRVDSGSVPTSAGNLEALPTQNMPLDRGRSATHRPCTSRARGGALLCPWVRATSWRLLGPSGKAGNIPWNTAPPSRAGRWSAVLLIIAGTLAACSSAASSPATTAAEPTGWRAPAVFSTPPDTGHILDPLSANPTDLAAHGYVEQEYFASGTAYSFTSRSTPSDGNGPSPSRDRRPTGRASSCDARATRRSSTGTSSWSG